MMIEKQNLWVVYNAGKSPAMDFIRGRERLLMADSGFLSDQFKIDYCSGGFVERRGIRHFNSMNFKRDQQGAFGQSLFKYHSFVQSGQHRIAIVTERETASNPLKVDYVLLSGNVDMEIAEILHDYKTGKVIIDATNSLKKANRWKEECEKLGIPCWSIPYSGAFISQE